MLKHVFRRSVLVAAALAAVAGSAIADEFLDKINATYKATRADQHSEGVLLPALAKLDPIPKSLANVPTLSSALPSLALLTPGAPEWKDAVAWATAPNQKAAIEAMDKVTSETDWRRALTVAFPYGTDGVPIDLIRSGMYCELGDPPTLAAVKLGYLKAFGVLRQLADVEATRRMAEGDAAGALKVAIDWTLVARQLVDRRYFAEVGDAMTWTIQGLERVRDIAYQDFRGPRKLTIQQIQDAIKRLGEDGPLAVERMRFPDGELVAAEQLVSRMYGSDGQVNADVFSATMARTGASQHPLQIFSETAKWRGVGASMPDKASTSAEIKKLSDDWSGRWGADAFDPIMSVAWEYPRMDRSRFKLIAEVIPDMTPMFGLRQALRTEAVGTRHALGLYGFWLIGNAFPLDIAGIRPRFMKELELDPFNPNRKNGGKPPLAFFVPMRDTKDQFPGGNPEPSELAILASNGENFTAKVAQDQFVLYSVGVDGARNWAKRVQNTYENVPNSDYLIWPPVTSLYRQHLIESGKLK